MSQEDNNESSNVPRKGEDPEAPKGDTGSKPSRRDQRKSANRARHRLLSIQYDVQHYLRPLLANQRKEQEESIVIVANERCGSWYALPLEPHSSCHFKSTDGHVHLFSLKRLNLPLLKTLHQQQSSCVWIVDASNKKEMPDSFSRTIPIWAAVLNRIAERYRRDEQLLESKFSAEQLELFLPDWIIPSEERVRMDSIIEDRVEELYQSRAIVDIPGFLELMTKPLRPFWITPLQQSNQLPTPEQQSTLSCLVCCNASNIRLDAKTNSRVVWMEQEQFWYTPGAADDEESWARKLTPQLFWGQHGDDTSTNNTPRQSLSSSMTEQEVDDWIDRLVASHQARRQGDTDEEEVACFDWIGNLGIAIGTRRAGRPPHCWKHFDAILNVTNTEYGDIQQQSSEDGRYCYYLQLPVQEGKRDKIELERWMPVGILFCALHASRGRRILIHCAQGRDRSVAVAMAVVQLFCNLTYPLEWNRHLLEGTVRELVAEDASCEAPPQNDNKVAETVADSLLGSGLPQHRANGLIDHDGRLFLLQLVREQLDKSQDKPLASKESLRVALHLIRQDREKAEPTRSTLQKLNRFFMSDAYKKQQPG